MRQAVVMGIGVNEFWEMTPRWFMSLAEGWYRQRRQEMRFDVTMAYLGAGWQRVKRMDSLAKTMERLGLDEPKRAQTQTTEQQIAAFQMWRTASAAALKSDFKPSARVFVPPSLARLRAEGSA
jgi:hypothetical protein